MPVNQEKQKTNASQSLTTLMNAMINRLDIIMPAELGPIPEEQKWPMIGVFMGMDACLAALYKEYCEAKARLSQSIESYGAGSAMTDIAADMFDSACCAIETRMLELKSSPAVRAQAAMIEQDRAWQMKKREEEAARQKQEKNFEDQIVFMLWMNMIFKSQNRARFLVRDFAQNMPQLRWA